MIKHETDTHWVKEVPHGYEVYRIGVTHSTRCAQIGWKGKVGLAKAITECERRTRRES